MGCKGSKLDEQEAVALCRGRADLLAAAVRHRYALADAHAALADSLASVAAALHLLMTAQPRLGLPTARKDVDAPPPSSPPHSSSHINFAPSSGSESGSVSSSPHRSVGQQQLHQPHPHPDRLPFPHYGYGGYGYAPEPPFGGYPPGSLRLYYARSRLPPASVAVEQRAAAPERVYYGSFEPAAGGYSQYYSYGGELAAAGRAAAPPPPSPPRASSWDFFNVFDDYDVYDNYCYDAGGAGAAASYTPSRSSREVRDEEGIPELEEDDVVVKQVASEFSTPGSGARSRRSSLSGVSSSIAEVDEEENCVVDKEVIGRGNVARQQASAQRNVTVSAPTAWRNVGSTDVAAEIKAQFVRAADAVKVLVPILEVGRRRYHPRSSVYHVSSRMVSAITVPHSDLGGVELLDVGGEKVVGERSLSFTLQKLYIWEKKLYDEVKAEEKMRLLLAKNTKRLKFLDQKGAEAHKIDTTRNLVRKLSTKIRITVKVIAKISKKINRVRDEELWPQINALVQGFVRMWQDKLNCYQIQCEVMSEAKNLDSIVSGGSSRDLALELELELIKWIVNFCCWVNEQKSFVKALNGWLALCLNYKAEETADGVPPYSPGRVGAPLVFVICNSWSQAMDRISEKEVVTSMQALVSSVRKLSEQHNVEQTEQIIATRERERWNKILERKTLEINKEADALNKKLALVPGRQSLLPSARTYQEHLLEASSLHTSLGRVVQALESFASNSLRAFEETLRHAEEERSSRDNAKVS
ncbi:protein ALTERED PHOSPHATE STARVATION RESPONSE 1-like [Phragmites australis]|uniref:protein ALTERED PHOSPHATE STARVATION RESPONSE 1-like n=1 Tax=Phragmites australis TaxID=29695 RepID=UPI002D791E21|nr:protein ALTERED PHOSPHATE STARVATION RESPONSE 1-like [Phragmites australis]